MWNKVPRASQGSPVEAPSFSGACLCACRRLCRALAEQWPVASDRAKKGGVLMGPPACEAEERLLEAGSARVRGKCGLTVTSGLVCAVGRCSLCGTAGRSGPGPRAAMPRGDERAASPCRCHLPFAPVCLEALPLPAPSVEPQGPSDTLQRWEQLVCVSRLRNLSSP